MRHALTMAGLAVLLAVASAASGLAQSVSSVHFDKGKSGATLSGTIKGSDYADFTLAARKGQTLKASIKVDGTNGDGTIYFNILPPGSDGEALFVGSMADGQAASLVLPGDGSYTIRVYLMGNDKDAGKTVGYLLSVSIH